ncbi:MAG TPA: GMC family oxidoreductase [Saprospiraceae bacterium]|nr:GMC family oxidoreductase [Saprospiraceae bacterium]
MYFNSEGENEVTYDAIVVGSGISGGWAAKELCEKGLKTLVLERGRDVKHGEYPTANLDSWKLPNWDQVSLEDRKKYPVQGRTNYIMHYSIINWFIEDAEQPYVEVKPFDWMRAYQVGGKSIVWGRHTYRWGEVDFEANAKDGFGVDWPIRYKDIAPWYDYVETFAGISGKAEGLAQCPDGKFLPEIELNCVEQHFREKLMQNMKGRIVTPARVAHLTSPLPDSKRGVCQFRNRCMRGCPYGAYFSSNASTLPAAYATNNLTLRPFSVVHSLIYDKESGKAKGVRVIDAKTKETKEFFAKVIFLNAGALNSTLIMMNSTSDRFPDGFGNDSGELGHNLMDHHFRVGGEAQVDGFNDKYYKGRKPAGFYMPRFRNLDAASTHKDYVRGFGYQGGGARQGWQRSVAELGVGAEWKDQWSNPGGWTLGILAFGECLPYHENKVTLDTAKLDPYGLPTLHIDCEWKENEMAMRKDMKASAGEMLEAAGFKNVRTYDDQSNPGLGIHEMGTARMGRDPKTSVLNEWNQVHACKNVFVTDGACMTSSACQNPSITYMALTARAADFAVKELNRQNL